MSLSCFSSPAPTTSPHCEPATKSSEWLATKSSEKKRKQTESENHNNNNELYPKRIAKQGITRRKKKRDACVGGGEGRAVKS